MKARAYASEFIGAFALLFVGAGAIATNQLGGTNGIGTLGIALAHGLVIAAVASAVGAISGGHFNPAVTMAALVGKRISIADALVYWIVQAAGGIAGIFVLTQAMDANALTRTMYGLPQLNEITDVGKGLIAETMFTFFLAFVVYGTAFFRRAPKIGALYVGFAVMMAGLVIGEMTGGSVNPVRWLGSAVFANGIDSNGLIVYVLGPLVGGALAGIIFGWFLEKEPELMEGTGGPAEDV